MSQQPLDIAIIGVAGIYPGAGNARQYWQNILDKVDAVRDADPEWVGPYFEETATDDDRIYTTRGGFLGEQDRKSGEDGKRGSVRVDLGGRRHIKKTTTIAKR